MSLINTVSADSSIPVRIGILDAASVLLPNAHNKYGNWATIFEQHLFSGTDALGLSRDHLHISKWDVVNGLGEGLGGTYPRLENVDAVLITGSRWLPFNTCPSQPFRNFAIFSRPYPPAVSVILIKYPRPFLLKMHHCLRLQRL